MDERDSRAPLRVVIADDDPSVVAYLSLALSVEDDGITVVGAASSAVEAADVVTALEPDVLVLDLRMPGGGLHTAELLNAVGASTRVLVFTSDDDGSELLGLLRAGIAGYVTKASSSDEVVAAIRAVAAGGTTYAPGIAAKAMGELTSRLHDERSQEMRSERVRQRIDRVIARTALTVALQPIIDLATNEVCGVEALARFEGPPTRPPDEWFAEAELVSRRVDLELAAARVALAHLDHLAEHLWLSVNVSPQTVLSGVIDRLFADVDLSRVVLELTEHASVDDYGFLNATLARWRDRGLRVAVDDAGGGFASFAHVVNARPDLIKLDRGLVTDIDRDPKKQALVDAIAQFAERVGCTLVAEGIENDRELEALCGLGVPLGQGFLLGKPLTLDDQPDLRAGAPG